MWSDLSKISTFPLQYSFLGKLTNAVAFKVSVIFSITHSDN